MYCYSCGKLIEEKAKYCFACGAKQPDVDSLSQENAVDSKPPDEGDQIESSLPKEEVTTSPQSPEEGALKKQSEKSRKLTNFQVFVAVMSVSVLFLFLNETEIFTFHDDSNKKEAKRRATLNENQARNICENAFKADDDLFGEGGISYNSTRAIKTPHKEEYSVMISYSQHGMPRGFNCRVWLNPNTSKVRYSVTRRM